MKAAYQRIPFLVLLAFLLPAAALAQPSPAYVRQVLPDATLVGQGLYRWFGLTIYKARLWGDKTKVTLTGWASSPFALELEYTRSLYGEKIAIASIDEIKKLGFGNSTQHEQWLTDMKKIFPNVGEGNQLTGILLPGSHPAFFLMANPSAILPTPNSGLLFLAFGYTRKHLHRSCVSFC